MEPYGFAYNKVFIDGMLREQMGFEGYINSDTGITHNMCWGVDMLDVPERIGYAVTHSGVDLISGLFDEEAGAEAYARATNDHYDTHPLPEGFCQGAAGADRCKHRPGGYPYIDRIVPAGDV